MTNIREKISSKKNVLIAGALIALMAIGSTFAYFVDRDSGNCSPSSEDIETTKRLAECGEILDIRMLDHIIVAGETGKMLSMKAEGSMPDIRKKDWER